MPDYPSMYRKLFAAQADAIEQLQATMDSLIKAHRQVEEMYVKAAGLELVPAIQTPTNKALKKD